MKKHGMMGGSSKKSKKPMTKDEKEIQKQIEELRQKEDYINAQLGKYGKTGGPSQAAAMSAAASGGQNQQPDSDEPEIKSEDENDQRRG